MKKIWFGVLGGVLLLGAAAAWLGQTSKFDAERIVAQSKLNGRSFKGKVQEVSALDGQVSAYLMEEHSVPMAVVAFGFDKAGRAYEPKEGVALLAEQVLLDGAGSYSRQALRAFMKERGIRLSVSAGQDRLTFLLSFVKAFEKDALDVLRAVLYEPKLAAEDLALARRQLAAVKRSQAEKPGYHLTRLIQENFYGTHPYGREAIPDDSVLAQVGAADIRAYLTDYTARDTLSVGMAGDMDKAEAEAFLTQAFSGLVEKTAAKDLPEFVPDFAQERRVDIPFSAQSYYLLAGAGVKRLDKDFYPLYLANYILGESGLSSILNQEVREKRGLTYGIYSFFSHSDVGALWQVSFSATPESAAQALQQARETYARFYDDGVTADQLAQAKKSLLNSFNLRFASLTNIAQMLEQMQVQQLGRDFLQQRQALVAAVKLEDVNDAIKRRMPKRLEPAGSTAVFAAEGKQN